MSVKARFTTAAVVLVVAIGYLVFSSASTSAEYYLTVSELKAKGPAVYGQNIRVAGIVDGPSIDRDARAGVLRFTASDASGPLAVVYTGGIVPDIFGPGIQVVVQGKYGVDGVFHAENLLAQCPSRYEDNLTAPA